MKIRKKNRMPKLYIVDGSSYFYRAYFALGALSTSKGVPTNAIFGFSNMLLKLIKDFNPEYLAIAFDPPTPSFRKKIYEDYKANREQMPSDLAQQIPYIKRVVEAFDIPALQKNDYEADDVIATVATDLAQQNWDVVIVSADKDLMQLVCPRIVMFDSMRNKTFTEIEVKEKFGVEPSQVVDVLALAGDTSDNIPGVPNIGLKTASKLIAQYSSIEKVYENLSKLSKRQSESLMAFKENALLSKELVKLKYDVPLTYEKKDIHYSGFNEKLLHALFQELEFNRLIKELGLVAQKNPKFIHYDRYRSINNEKEMNEAIEKILQEKKISMDFETTGKNPLEVDLVGMAVSLSSGDHFYIPLRHKQVPSGVVQLSEEKFLKKFKPLFEDPKIAKIGQNLKYELCLLKKRNITLRGICDDTMIASYLINPEMAHNLDALSAQYLSHQSITYGEVVPNKDNTFADVELVAATEYACEDSEMALKLADILRCELENLGMVSLYENIEVPLVSVLADMEVCGIKMNQDFLRHLSQQFEKEIQESEKKIFDMAGEPFNVRSTKQLGVILFDKLKLPVQRKTKTGYSTDEEVLQKLAKHHEIVALLLDHRELSKLKSTYIDAFFDLIDKKTGRLHTSFNQAVTSTGRLSSSNPNLQNIPIRTQRGKLIRQAFIADEGFVLLSADYSQVELRIMAHLSQDEVLMKAFKNNQDIHSLTGQEIFQKKEISEDERRIAKAINFGIIYGQSPYGLARSLGISSQDAENYIRRYFEKYRGVSQYLQKILYDARKLGFTATILGRRRYHPNLRSSNRGLSQAAERMAINAPIQGSASDLIKKAMIEIHKALENKKSKLLLQVHDELVCEVHRDEQDDVVPMIVSHMENAIKIDVPLKVDVTLSKNWAGL
ncbi:MAG: DNA polymerase I [Deltaproteobacteria bacterium]|nr:DNA polymerase I [Deltaproteobacteria bacterium]